MSTAQSGRPAPVMPGAADAVLASRGRSFHWARRWLGPTHAANATRLYAFCRYLDDLADDAPSAGHGRIALDAVRDAVMARRAIDPVVADGLALMQECRIDLAVMLELIRGVRSDLEPVRMADETELLRYCYRVAGTVGLMMCSVLGVNDPTAFRHAIDLGIGMQLTNICRDVSEDAAMGRRYLPASLLGDIAPEALVAPVARLHPRLRSTLAALLSDAERYYASGEQGLAYLPANARLGVLVAARLYRQIGRALARRHYACWEERTVVSRGAKIAVTGCALWQTATGPWPDPRSVRHDPMLHAALAGLPGTALPALAPHAA